MPEFFTALKCTLAPSVKGKQKKLLTAGRVSIPRHLEWEAVLLPTKLTSFLKNYGKFGLYILIAKQKTGGGVCSREVVRMRVVNSSWK